MESNDRRRRRICVITTSRADYGHLYWPLKELQAKKNIDLNIVVMGAHLAPEFGLTVREIEADGFEIDDTIECLISSDTDTGMAKTIGLAILGLSDSLTRLRPDILLVIADRYEMLAPATVALALRIPIAHIEGGDVSEGAIDDAVRNALTKMSHLHFAPSARAKERILAMGEEPWRVHQVGACSLDHLRRSTVTEYQQLRDKLILDPAPIVVSYHPVTLEKNTTSEADALYQALRQINTPIVFCFPNTDAGSHDLIQRAKLFCQQHKRSQLIVNLPHLSYWGLLRHACLLLGNSSSGIMETPAISLPTVNIGDRQKGRERAQNVIDVPADVQDILAGIRKAQTSEFKESLEGMTNPYGDGYAGEKIAEALSTCPLGTQLLIKKNIL